MTEIKNRIQGYQDMLDKLKAESTPTTKEWYDKRIATIEGKIQELNWVLNAFNLSDKPSYPMTDAFLSSPVYERNTENELIYTSESGKHSINLRITLINFMEYCNAVYEAKKSNKNN
jgi:hypothetical protein